MSDMKPKTATNNPPLNINQALVFISRNVKAIGKDSINTGQHFKFRGIDAVMNALHPIFAEAGVVILPEIISERTEDRTTKSGSSLIYRILTVKFRFVAEDGTEQACTMIGEGMDSGDKAANKAMAVALKYALTQMNLLPYDEVDPDATTPEPSKPKQEAPKEATPEASKGKAVTAETVATKTPQEKTYDFLRAMAECKTSLGEKVYYEILKQHNATSSKEITHSSKRNAVYHQMTQQIKANADWKLNGDAE